MAAWAIINNQGKILLIRRSHKTSRPGQWCFPGGGVKTNETPAQACIREVAEETGLVVIPQQSVEVIDNSHYFSCQLADTAAKVQLKYNECDDFVWVKPSDVLSVGKIMELKNLTTVFATMGHDIKPITNNQSLG